MSNLKLKTEDQRVTVITRSLIFGLIGLTILSCASLSPPLMDAPKAAVDEDNFLKIEAVEAHSNGLELMITMSQSPREGSILEIVRYRPGEAPEVLSSIEVDPQLAESLTDGVAYYEQDIQPGPISYDVVLTHPSQPGFAFESPRIDIELSDPPAQPLEITARPLGPNLVELEWLDASSQHGFAIFRRDVLDETSRPTRLADLLPGEPHRFYDQSVNPGHVYAYRIVAADAHDAWLHFGTPSEEIYVTLPDATVQ